MGDIAEMMIAAELAGMDYESYCVELAWIEIDRVKKAKKKAKKVPVVRPQVAKAGGK